MSDDSRSFVALRPCGCVCGAAVITVDHAGDTGKWVERWRKAGLAIVIWTTPQVRAAPWGCVQCRPKQHKLQEPGAP